MNPMLFLSRRDVEGLLTVDNLIETLATAMVHLSAGEVSMAPRTTVRIDQQGGFLGSMLSHVEPRRWLASKLVSVMPSNTVLGIPTHQAVITVFDPETGAPTALMDGTYITEARTAAGSALATKVLSREDSGVMAILGTGVQAAAHGRIVPRVRKLNEIRIAGRDSEKAQKLASKLKNELGLPVIAVTDFESAMRDADIVCAATHSPDPVIRRSWVRSGMHVNSVGVNPAGREVDAEVVRDSFVVVESLAAALSSPSAAGANDLVWPIRDGVISPDHIHTEIGQILSGAAKGRTSEDDITLYKSVGVAVQDAAAAALVIEAARSRGVGIEVEI